MWCGTCDNKFFAWQNETIMTLEWGHIYTSWALFLIVYMLKKQCVHCFFGSIMQEIFLRARNLLIVQSCLTLVLQKNYQFLSSKLWLKCFWHLLRFVKTFFVVFLSLLKLILAGFLVHLKNYIWWVILIFDFDFVSLYQSMLSKMKCIIVFHFGCSL